MRDCNRSTGVRCPRRRRRGAAGARRDRRRRRRRARSRRCARSTVKFSEAGRRRSATCASPIRSRSPARAASPAGSGRWAERPRLAVRLPRAAAAGHALHARSCAPTGSRASGAASAPQPPRAPRDRTDEFTFSTGGPAVVSMQPGGGGEIEEDQHFLLRLNGPAVEATRRRQRLVRGRRHRRAAAAARRRRRRAGAGAEGAPHRRKARPSARCSRAAQRPLPNGAARAPGLGQGHRRGGNPKIVTTIEQRFRFAVRAAFTRRVQLRARARRRAVPADPADDACASRRRWRASSAAQVRAAAGRAASALAPVFDKDDKADEVSEV